MSNYTRIALIHLASTALLAVLAVVVNVLVWSVPPDPFPDTMWNLLIMPFLRALAGIGGVYCVLYGATSPVTLRLLRMRKNNTSS